MAEPWVIKTGADTNAPACQSVRGWLRAYNVDRNPAFMRTFESAPLDAAALIVYASAEQIVVGGIVAETRIAWLKIQLMAVDPALRGRGIGSALLDEAERQAVDRGCRYAYVDTMDYQSPEFYTARGFSIVGRIEDWDSHGHAKYFLTKNLQRQG